MTKFENDVQYFYEIGGTTFLTKGETVGDDETFYMHCLISHLPKIAKDTLKDHNIGLVVFTMQGCEHQNRQAILIWSSFNNNTNLVIYQNLKRIHDNFKYK